MSLTPAQRGFSTWTPVKVSNPQHERYPTSGYILSDRTENEGQVIVRFDRDNTDVVMSIDDLQALV